MYSSERYFLDATLSPEHNGRTGTGTSGDALKGRRAFLEPFNLDVLPITAPQRETPPPHVHEVGAFLIKFPAAIYSPTQLPVQYHRP